MAANSSALTSEISQWLMPWRDQFASRKPRDVEKTTFESATVGGPDERNDDMFALAVEKNGHRTPVEIVDGPAQNAEPGSFSSGTGGEKSSGAERNGFTVW